MLSRLLFSAALLAASASAAQAVCIYHGQLYVRTTLDQEFRDARWVVRARVVSGLSFWSDESESWTRYRLEVVHSYKGTIPRRFDFFTERNSGGFYLDAEGSTPDIGGEYLLFLVSLPHRAGPPEARRALWVNYNCGQSRSWREVTSAQRRRLQLLSRQ